MPPLSITHLEQHIDRLILTCHELRMENQRLTKQLQQLATKKSQLLAQQQRATTQIKQVMQKIREEIHERSA